MMQPQVNAGPQRGRRSQHHAARPNSKGNGRREVEGAGGSSEYPSPPSSPSSPITQQPGRGGLGGLNEPHALESGYFNKYADDKGEPTPIDQHHKQLVRLLIIH
jgi:hypothetical protein